MTTECNILLDSVDLVYDLHFDRTSTLKERLVNAVQRRSYVQERSRKLHALSKISLSVSHGERLGVIGRNGAGKSTLLKVLARLLKPTQGSVDIRGTVQPLIELGAGFNLEFSGRENIFLNGAMLGFSRKEMRATEQEIIEFSELGDFIDVPVKYYSSGMVVRLAFTIATTVKPEILLLDEMLSAGDIQFVDKARARIQRLLDDSKILVLVSHDLELMRSLTTRCLIMEAGCISFDGPTEEAVKLYRDKAEAQNENSDLSPGT